MDLHLSPPEHTWTLKKYNRFPNFQDFSEDTLAFSSIGGSFLSFPRCVFS